MSIADLLHAAEYLERRERGKPNRPLFRHVLGQPFTCPTEAEHGYATPLQQDLNRRRSKSKKSQGSR